MNRIVSITTAETMTLTMIKMAQVRVRMPSDDLLCLVRWLFYHKNW
jgi:hypothetical protein